MVENDGWGRSGGDDCPEDGEVCLLCWGMVSEDVKYLMARMEGRMYFILYK